MANYQLLGNSEWFDALVGKTVQYLSVRQKRARLQVSAPQRIAEGSDIRVSAELYNESFELTNDPEVGFELVDDEGNAFSYVFQPDGQGYGLSIGSLKTGRYRWSASASMNGEVFEESGELLVSEVKAEQMVTRADHHFLRQWAFRENGEAFYASNASALTDRLLGLEQAKPQVDSTKQWSELIEWKWLLGLLVLLLSIEGLLRKYHGSY